MFRDDGRPPSGGGQMSQDVESQSARRWIEEIVQPLTAPVARAEVAGEMARGGELDGLAQQFAAMHASAEALAAQIRAARAHFDADLPASTPSSYEPT